MVPKSLLIFCVLVMLGILVITGMHPAVQSTKVHQSSQVSSRSASDLLVGAVNTGTRLVVVGERGHILYSDDQGASWLQAQSPSKQLLTAVFFVDAQHGWAVGHDAQVLATTNGGITWVLQFEDPNREAPLLGIWFKDARQGFAVGAYGLLLTTDDGGLHWKDVSDRIDNPDRLHLNAITSVNGAGLLIVGEQGSVFRSSDEGLHWQQLPVPYDGTLFGVVSTARTHTLLVYGLRGHLLRSTDSGESWQAIALPGARGSLEFGLTNAILLDDGTLMIVGDGGTVLRSDDDGLTFSRVSRADRLALVAVAPVSADRLILVGQGGVHIASANGDEVAQP